MNLVQRAQDILLKPKETWPAIAAEPATVSSLYQEWLLVVAAIPPLATFVGLSVIGMGGFGYGFRVPVFAGLGHLVLSYALSLLAVYVLAQIVDLLAPTFGGTRDPLAALKLVAYGGTAGFVGGVFNLLPMLWGLGLLAGLYSIYLIYLGLPVLMRCPRDRAAGYTALVVLIGVVAMMVMSTLAAMALPARHMQMGDAPAPARLAAEASARHAPHTSRP